MWGTNISVFSFTGDGLISSNGNRWFRMRKLLTPAFHFEILKPYVRVFQESTDTLLVWSKLVTENPIPPSLAFWKLLVRPDERKENRAFSVADPGGGPGAPLFLDETKARRAVACENIRFSSLFAAGDVSRGGTSATQRQKFHTDDVKSVWNPVRSADWSTQQLHCFSYCLWMTDKKQKAKKVKCKREESRTKQSIFVEYRLL